MGKIHWPRRAEGDCHVDDDGPSNMILSNTLILCPVPLPHPNAQTLLATNVAFGTQVPISSEPLRKPLPRLPLVETEMQINNRKNKKRIIKKRTEPGFAPCDMASVVQNSC